jgi:DNA ligase 3
MKSWYHVDCFFDLKKAKNTKTMTCSGDVDGWELLSSDEKQMIIKKIGSEFKESSSPVKKAVAESLSSDCNDNKFSEFQRIVRRIANEPSYTSKSNILQRFLQVVRSERKLKKGIAIKTFCSFQGTGKKFEGDVELWLRLLIPKDQKRVYNLQDKQIVKIFVTIFRSDHQDMTDDVAETGDVSETVAKFFEKSRKVKPVDNSTLSLQEVDEFLEELQNLTQEAQQVKHFETIIEKCSIGDLRTIVRLIKHDLKMNCGARHVLDAIHVDAYAAFQKSRNLKNIIKDFTGDKSKTTKTSGLRVMTAISPMLAEPCKDFEKAIKKYPEGFYSEIKYDGERVQIHKEGDDFKFFSRNLKPVMDHKVKDIEKYLPKAFPHGNDLIIDSEILMVDTKTDQLLPFGTLGKHKKEGCSSAVTCLFIFDCLLFNGEDLTKKTMKERRKFLEENITPIKHRIVLSEYKVLKTKNDLVDMTKDVLVKGLEGLMLKGLNTVYEPGKRRWLKVKKDYLMEGALADTADLVVLGAWYGSGKNGGQFSVYLMGCLDKKSGLWKTVTKVGTGFDDRGKTKMHSRLDPLMDKFDNNSRLPKWVDIKSSMKPDALAKDPMAMPVFEVEGAEFTDSTTSEATKEGHHTNPISIRFPRIKRIRDDKSPKEATNMNELMHLYEESKSGEKLDLLDKLKSKDSAAEKGKITSIFTKIASTSNKRKSSSESEEEKSPKKPKVAKSPPEIPKVAQKPKRKSVDAEDEIPAKKSKVSNDDGIFQNFTLFITPNIKSEDIAKFKGLGGSCTDNSLSANLVLHGSDEIDESLENLRKIYDPKCRHYEATWLTDSLKEQKAKNPLKYYVKLHQI